MCIRDRGINFSGQQEIIDKAFSIKKALAIAVSINSPGGSPVQSHLIYSYIKKLAKKNNADSSDLLQSEKISTTTNKIQNGENISPDEMDLIYESKITEWKEIDDLHSLCVEYATVYTEGVLKRAKKEDPDVFAVKGMSKHEM